MYEMQEGDWEMFSIIRDEWNDWMQGRLPQAPIYDSEQTEDVLMVINRLLFFLNIVREGKESSLR
jgi:hypothetical protein